MALTKTPEIKDAPSSDSSLSETMSRSQIAAKIIEDSGLVEAWSDSVCVHCGNRVMIRTRKGFVHMYCRSLHRDIKTIVTQNTDFTPD